MAEKMKFWRIPMRDGLFDYVIMEDSNENSAWESAQNLPPEFGEPDEEAPMQDEVKKPFAEPWPIFPEAYIKAVYGE